MARNSALRESGFPIVNKAKSESTRRISRFQLDIYQLWDSELYQDLTLQEFRIALADLLYRNLIRTHKPKQKAAVQRGRTTDGKT